jgi:heterodisulfide reductase subunit D
MAEGTGKPHTQLLEALAKAFNPGKVLTDPVDLYVYSFHGEFATRRLETPVAVLRRLSEGEEKELEVLARASGIQVIRNDETQMDGPGRVGTPIVILDSREPFTSSTLQERLTELEGTWAEGKQRLKGASSFADWFVSSLRMKDGYRIGERPGCDDGFCAVQPFLDGVETFSSKGRLLLTRGLLKGELEPTERLVDAVYTCTACGQCYDQLGSTGLEVNNAIVRGRHEIVKSGMGPRQCGLLSRNIREDGNPLGMPAEDRTLWHEELAEEFPFKGNETLYWAGCSTSFRLPGIIEATTNVLQGAGLDFGLLGEKEGCCGLILYLLGLWDEARGNALETSKKLVELGAKRLVTSCAGCYYAFTRVYQTLDVSLPLEILHTSQLLGSLIREDRLQLGGLKGSFMWHDPCDLGRHCQVYEEPREVLRAIPDLDLRELPLNRGHALCCGGGGGLMMYDIGLSEKVAHSKIIEEVMPLGIDGVVTGCPACILSLRNAAKTLGEEIDIYDLSEIVDRCV